MPTFNTKVVMTDAQLHAETVTDAEVFYGALKAKWTNEYNQASAYHKEMALRADGIEDAEQWVSEMCGRHRAVWQRAFEMFGDDKDAMLRFMMNAVRRLRAHRVDISK